MWCIPALQGCPIALTFIWLSASSLSVVCGRSLFRNSQNRLILVHIDNCVERAKPLPSGWAMISLFCTLFLLLVCFLVVERTSAHPREPTKTIGVKDDDQHHIPASSATAKVGGQPPNCFPAIGFKMPADVDDIMTDRSNWWCDYNTEYAFLGFSYEVTACKSKFSGWLINCFYSSQRSESRYNEIRIWRHQAKIQRKIRSFIRGLRQERFLVSIKGDPLRSNKFQHLSTVTMLSKLLGKRA